MTPRTSLLSVAQGLFRLGVRREISHPAALLAQCIFMVVILYIFANLWVRAFESGFVSYSLPSDFVWYLYVTELVALTTPQIFRGVQEEIQSGDIVQRLLKPIPFPLVPFCEGLGITAARLAAMVPFGFVMCMLLTGGLPANPVGLLTALVLVPFSCATLLVFFSTIGMFALWIHDAMPLYWIFSKILFVLGGLMLPLSIYPEWLQEIARWTPFYVLMYGIARNVFQTDTGLLFATFMLLVFWATVALVVLSIVYRSLTRRLVVGGG